MLELHFNELVEELEVSAADNQSGYRLKVALLAALGYVYVFVAIALLVLGAYLVVRYARFTHHPSTMAWAIPFLLLALMAVRSLWVLLPPPEGTEITQAQAPQLFALLAKIRAKL